MVWFAEILNYHLSKPGLENSVQRIKELGDGE